MPEQLQLDFTASPPRRPTATAVSVRPPAKPAQPELPRDETESGYAALRAEQAEALRQLEARFGVVLNRRVRVTLAGLPGEFVGTMKLAQLLQPSQRGEELRLRIGTVSFDYSDVESCVIVDGGSGQG